MKPPINLEIEAEANLQHILREKTWNEILPDIKKILPKDLTDIQILEFIDMLKQIWEVGYVLGARDMGINIQKKMETHHKMILK